MNSFARYRAGSIQYNSQRNESFPSNPEKVGTGVWFVLHLKSRHANDDSTIQSFLNDFELVIQNFPCLKCRKHMMEYVRDHNPTSYINYTYNGQKLGMFRYIWEFHNEVNRRVGKPMISWEDALKMFSTPDSICTHCDANKEGLDLVLLPGFNVVNKNSMQIQPTYNPPTYPQPSYDQPNYQQSSYQPNFNQHIHDHQHNEITVKGEPQIMFRPY